ncbi:MAG TPA: glutamine amidotransferase, partial [Planctomycetota bacterium]|nr:glutamine amidotransferase [Planctomycetota bacterium]
APADFETLVRAMAKDGISVSTVCVGAGPRFDEQLMSRIAVWGGGEFKFTASYANVPELFFTMVQKVLAAVPKDDVPPAAPPKETPPPTPPNDPPPTPQEPEKPAVFPVVAKDPHQALDGLDAKSLPPVHGRLDAAAAPGPDVAVPLAMGDGKPLLAFGRAGLGRTGAWTSDLGGRWSVPWHAWKDTGKLLAQAVRHLMAEAPDVELARRVRIMAEGNSAWLRIEAGEAVTVRDPGSGAAVELRTEEDGSLAARLPLEAPGVLKPLQVQGPDGRRVVVGAVRAYEEEFAPVGPSHDLFAARLEPLAWTDLPGALSGPPSTGERRVDLALWLALAAALLLPLDVALRRIQR